MAVLDADEADRFQLEAFDAYFTRGVFPDEKGLLDCARRAGVDAKVKALYDDPQRLDARKTQALREAAGYSQSGITGVPFFFFQGRPAFSGARDVADFVDVLRQAKDLTEVPE
mmetsp:Transcript_11738/g.38637  ORF Transcript_11738/g.38637 Transcript_11738/m.38637 type:complete len:113 (-) Transcript_11738:281-619(-)